MSASKTVAEWAAEAFRPCCGTCRAPMLNRKMENLQSCGTCGAHWDGSEASEREATYRTRGTRLFIAVVTGDPAPIAVFSSVQTARAGLDRKLTTSRVYLAVHILDEGPELETL